MRILSTFFAVAVISICGPGYWPLVAEDGRTYGQSKSDSNEIGLRCTISVKDVRWSEKQGTPTVGVEFSQREQVTGMMLASVHLVSKERQQGLSPREYWAPFSLRNGKAVKEWQKLQFPASGSLPSVSLNPVQLRWALVTSSVWP